jgi:hypothetical protein
MSTGVFFGVPMQEYLLTGAVGASTIKTMLERCPKAAWHESWLNPKRPSIGEDHTTASDTGTIGHDVLLEGGDLMEAIDPSKYPTKSSGNIPTGLKGNKEIKAAAEAVRAAGKIPILAADVADIRAMVQSAWAFLDSLKGGPSHNVWQCFQPGGGDSEVTVIWDEAGTMCKCRPDRISKDRRTIVDAKFTGTSAEPDLYGRTQLIRMGGYISAAWYQRGIAAACGVMPEYFFLVVETSAPYLCSLVGVDPHGMELGAQKVEASLRHWQSCCIKQEWPGYPARACYPEIPAWVDAEWTEKQIDSTPYWEQP